MWPTSWYWPTRRVYEPDGQWVLVTGPAQEPITIDDAKRHLRISQTQDDVTIRRMLQAAREAGEDYMNRGFFTQTWKFTLARWADQIALPRAAPLQSVTTVQYYDSNNALQTLSTSIYDVDTTSRPGRITRASNQSWPALSADRHIGRVVITYVVGFTSVDLIPERWKQGIRIYLGLFDRNRDGLEVGGDKAREAAEACWSDIVQWIEPTVTYGVHDQWPF